MRPAVVTPALLLVVLLCVDNTEQTSDEKKMETMCGRYALRYCGNGWYRLDQDRCMKFFSHPKTFEKAEEHCNDVGNHLVSIHDEEQRIRLDCLAWNRKKALQPFWIGAKSRREKFEYTDGSYFDYTSWHYKVSNYFLDKYSCTLSNYKAWGAWGFAGCTHRYMYVCTKHA